MAGSVRRNPRTASHEQSIWSELPEDLFRGHLIALEERTNAVPTEPAIFDIIDRNHTHDEVAGGEFPLLPIALEQQLANDFAWIAAVEEGAQSVAACYLQQSPELDGLRIRLAAVDVIDESLASKLRNVCEILTQAASCSLSDQPAILERLFHLILKVHHRRILGRLRSCKWQKPAHLIRSHKKPLWQDFANLKHRVQFLYTKKEDLNRQTLEKLIDEVASEYKHFEEVDLETEKETIPTAHLVLASLQFCQATHVQDYLERLERVRATAQIASAVKCLRQIEKIAAYRRICMTLINAANNYRSLFKHIDLDFSTPFATIQTSIGYETWAQSCHVHAEVQLILDYDKDSAAKKSKKYSGPRTIGTSKDLCYLCYLFIIYHGTFQPRSTHGRLYDQWTVPDLAEFTDEERRRYRKVLRSMDDTIVKQTSYSAVKRVEPMTSRQDLKHAYQSHFVTRSEH